MLSRFIKPPVGALRTDVATLVRAMSDGGARALSLTDVLGAIGALRTEVAVLRTELRTEFGALRTDIATLQTNWGVLLEFASSDVISSQFGASLGASCTLRSAEDVACVVSPQGRPIVPSTTQLVAALGSKVGG
mgnify:CR=1 FL=1